MSHELGALVKMEDEEEAQKKEIEAQEIIDAVLKEAGYGFEIPKERTVRDILREAFNMENKDDEIDEVQAVINAVLKEAGIGFEAIKGKSDL